MSNDKKIRTYEILAEFFVIDFETRGLDDGRKMKTFFRAAKDNGIRTELIDFRSNDPASFRFKATRKQAAGLFFDLCEADIIGDDLLNDFSNCFEVLAEFYTRDFEVA